jgi:uncharacterized protein YegL
MKAMICLILDRSGSMAGREKDVIGGVNSFIEEQKKLPDPAAVTMVRFDTENIERFRPMGPLAEVQPITAADFQPRGGTPLLDAVGSTITALEDDWRREQPERCIVVIVTDGEENSSREYTKAKIKELIQSRQDSGKWAFIYLGANVDAFSEAGSMGIATSNSAGYQNTARGIATAYAAVTDTVSNMRMTGTTVAHNLGTNLGEGSDVLTAPPLVTPRPTAKQVPPTAAAPWVSPTPAAPWTPPK